ncbi:MULTISPECIES: contact-dependent growth inhibition system immunity protein [unclassified Pseudomonas]|uniref:contact-dependent growth inhibition system immunity protein n=1 Tax=unclassified Pseudomonas TaxID=196821 RepID=UPI001CBB80EC|nr:MULTISPECIES: contact-dependent growth inhibition system immunity protein [unclassified Pseudomonas]
MKFRDLEKEAPNYWLPENHPSPLTEWYLSVRDTPLEQLSVGDVCRTLRQGLFVCEILPIAVALLNDDVLAGERYDGELIAALAGVNTCYWQASSNAMLQTVCALNEVKHLTSDAELLRDSSNLKRMLGELMGNSS